MTIKSLLLASVFTLSATLPALCMNPGDKPSDHRPVAKRPLAKKIPAKKTPGKQPKAPAKKGPAKKAAAKQPGVPPKKAAAKQPGVPVKQAVAPISRVEVQQSEIKLAPSRKINSQLSVIPYTKKCDNNLMMIILYHTVTTKKDFLNCSLTCRQMYHTLPYVAKFYRPVFLERINAEANHPVALDTNRILLFRPNEFCHYAELLQVDGSLNPAAVVAFEEENGPLMRCWLEGRYRHAFDALYNRTAGRIQASAGLQSMDNYAPGNWNFASSRLRLLPTNITTPQIASACRYLDLSENSLIEVPAPLGKMTNLKELDLTRNGLEILPSTLVGLTQLKKLSLRCNNLVVIPPVVLKMQSLEELVLGSEGGDTNHIEEIPAEIIQLTRLQNLMCSCNKLKKLPSQIGQLSNLRGIWLNGNELESVCPELFNLSGLTQLFLSHNKISSLPRTIGNLTNVTWLYLYDNQLTSVPDEIGSMASLKKLLLGGNKLKSLCSGVLRLRQLEELDVSNNKIVAFPVGFSTMPCLNDLNLSVNPVKDTKALFADLRKFKGRGTYCNVRYFQKYGPDSGLFFEYKGQ